MDNGLYCPDRYREHPNAAYEWLKLLVATGIFGLALIWMGAA